MSKTTTRWITSPYVLEKDDVPVVEQIVNIEKQN